MKDPLHGGCFDDMNEVIQEVEGCFPMEPGEFYSGGLRKVKKRREKCVTLDGQVDNKQQKHVLIVYAEHEPKSFKGDLLRTAVETLRCNGHTVEVSDLYSMHFEPRTERSDIVGNPLNTDIFSYQRESRTAYKNDSLSDDIKAEVEKLRRADLVIFIFPLYWFSFPAIMKGWFDRIFVFGFAYGNGQLYHGGPMNGKKAMLVFTTGAPEIAFTPKGMNGDINIILWTMQHGTLTFVGFDVLAPFICYATEYVDGKQLKTWLSDWSKRLDNVFEESPLNVINMSNFVRFELRTDYLESQASNKYGPSVGNHLGKPFRPDSMVKP